jgi:serine/threonine-protein kinase
MAPEQAKDRVVNELTDVYNFGATMYRLVTGHLPPSTVPAAGGIPMDAKLWQSLLKPVREYNPQAPEALCDLIHRCLSYDARNRPERVSEVQNVLDRLADELVTSPEDSLEKMKW